MFSLLTRAQCLLSGANMLFGSARFLRLGSFLPGDWEISGLSPKCQLLMARNS